jgi:hypothetical protein
VLTTWIFVGLAVAVAWAGRKPIAFLLCDALDRRRRPRRLVLVVPPQLDRWPELEARDDRSLTW